MAKVCSSFQTGERNFYEIVIFLTPIYRLMPPYALKKVRFLKTHFLPPIQKKIFSYIQIPQTTPGLFNNRIRSWFVSLTRIYPYSLAADDQMPGSSFAKMSM